MSPSGTSAAAERNKFCCKATAASTVLLTIHRSRCQQQRALLTVHSRVKGNTMPGSANQHGDMGYLTLAISIKRRSLRITWHEITADETYILIPMRFHGASPLSRRVAGQFRTVQLVHDARLRRDPRRSTSQRS